MTERPHLWQGEWIGDDELTRKIASLPPTPGRALEPSCLLEAAEIYASALRSRQANHAELTRCLDTLDADAVIQEMAAFLDREDLELKLRRELGSVDPFLPRRTQYSDSIFEAWAPLGFLVHVAPANSPTVAPASAVEGLLSGNVNFLKTSSTESLFAQHFLSGLVASDPSGILKDFVIAARISSREDALLGKILSSADGIAVWGGEEAVRSVRAMAPQASRLIDWGHKISFIYLTKETASSPRVLEDCAREICAFEQQACSSPQCLFLDSSDFEELKSLGSRLADALTRVSPQVPRTEPDSPERAEITLTTELAREEGCHGQLLVLESPDKAWRVLVDSRPALTPSPLYRTVWVKPLPREAIERTLKPMRSYLQTAGLACGLRDTDELASRLVQGGVVRIRRVGEMPGSYSGEAHDGVYALQRYCKRVSLQLPKEASGISSFADLRPNTPPHWKKNPPLMTKAEFQESQVDRSHAHLFFKSGGSTGEPKLSIFTYEDYHEQMRVGAEGLYAAGLDPLRDRSMNLFFCGAMYGGFLSIFSVLESLQAPQLPMAAQLDFAQVIDAIVRLEVNVLLGMPSYLIQLFEAGGERLKQYGRIEKVFYGGEHFNDAQRRYLKENFGIKLIKSVGYGSVDTGPLAYQCRFSEGGEHHLHQRLQFLEILDLVKDEPAQPGTVGRLIFTSRMRKGQRLERYELGDVGHWVEGSCPCGRVAPRFRLLGRSGDVFRIGTAFFNYQKFVQILSETMNYSGPVQLVLSCDKKEKIAVRLAREHTVDLTLAKERMLAGYEDLHEVAFVENLLDFELEAIPAEAFEKTRGSGKLVRIIDLRSR